MELEFISEIILQLNLVKIQKYITFLQNYVDNSSSAIFLSNYSTALFDKNSKVIFISNKAIYGTVYSTNSKISFENNANVVFRKNKAYGKSPSSKGGAIYAHYTNISFEDNSTIKFNDNNYCQ